MVHTDVEDFVGFKDEEEAIINRLTRGSRERDIVSIVGMPGLGKTTLAKKVCVSLLDQKQFHKFAWCTISQLYKRRELLSAILEAVGTSVDKIQEKSEEDLQHLLCKSLKGQKYLIVIDDIWDIDAWEELQQSFPNDRNGSRIMLTSRIGDVALNANPDSPPHFLRSFSDDECWELLRKKLPHTDVYSQDFIDVGMQIAKKCKGLPLAVVLTAGLLKEDVQNLDWWRQIEKSIGSHIAVTSCMDILELSYNHLPDFLKPCFLYFGAFQEDRKIDAKILTKLWIGEGFILNPGSKSLKEVAQEYLKDLISRNLVFVSEKSYNGGIKECYMHDLILQLCLQKAKEENFMELVREDDIKAKLVGSQSNPTRYDKYRLSIHADPSSFIDSSAVGPHVRSLIFPFSLEVIGFSDLINFCNNFKFLEVLHLWFLLGGFRPFQSFPIELTSLVHLKYLAVMCRINSIPPSIANLENLENFLVDSQYEFGVELPNTIWKMRRLRHVKIGTASISSTDHLIDKSYQLDNIESFKSIVLQHEGDAESLLRRMPRVRKLQLKIFKSWDNLLSVLGSLSKLETLGLVYEDVFCNPSFYVCQPYPSSWEMEPYPYAISYPSSLKKLSLWGLRRPWEEISVIGKLPNLEVLKLSNYAFLGEIWDVAEEEFLNLKCLKLFQLDFSQWNASSDTFPCLGQLYVDLCRKLEGIPSSFGAIPTLNMIYVHWCSDAATRSARQIVEEQQELGNKDLEVHIN